MQQETQRHRFLDRCPATWSSLPARPTRSNSFQDLDPPKSTLASVHLVSKTTDVGAHPLMSPQIRGVLGRWKLADLMVPLPPICSSAIHNCPRGHQQPHSTCAISVMFSEQPLSKRKVFPFGFATLNARSPV